MRSTIGGCTASRLVLCGLLLQLVGVHAYIHEFFPSGQQPLHESLKIAHDSNRKGAVASESKHCSEQGIRMLDKGGTAADVMVATVLCVGTVNMYHSGIGGGGFMVIRYPDPAKSGEFKYDTIDFREAAPAGAHQNMFEGIEERAQVGGLASAVPGELRGLDYLRETYGNRNLTWKDLTEPAIIAARDGFQVTKDLNIYMNRAVGNGEDFLLKYPWSETFARPDGTRVGVGDTIKRTRYAQTLQTIANEDSVTSFYEGDIAEKIAKAVQDNDGIMTVEDLKNYKMIKREPLQVTYRNHTLTSIRAPASGFIALNVLKVLDYYDNNFFNGSEKTISVDTHRMVEAMRFGYAMRPKLGDPAGKPYIDSFQKDMLSDANTFHIYEQIKDNTTFEEGHYNPGGYGIPKGGGTSHLVAADDSGLAISLITSVNLFFGSHVMDEKTGIIMNDSMDDFAIPGTRNAFNYVPAPENFIRPGKRPQSSMSPLIVSGENLTFLTGSAGGSYITSTTIQNVLHVLNQGLNSSEALGKARLHDQVNPYYCTFEHGQGFNVPTEKYNPDIVAHMARVGHNVSWIMPGLSTSQAVLWHGDGEFEGAGEPRQNNSGWAWR